MNKVKYLALVATIGLFSCGKTRTVVTNGCYKTDYELIGYTPNNYPVFKMTFWVSGVCQGSLTYVDSEKSVKW
jgi:hypothetical protein